MCAAAEALLTKSRHSDGDGEGSEEVRTLRPKIRRSIVFSLLHCCAADFPPETPTLLLMILQKRAPINTKVVILRCLREFMRSGPEEVAAARLWGGLWGAFGCPSLPMPHCRRVEASYEEHASDCKDKRYKSLMDTMEGEAQQCSTSDLEASAAASKSGSVFSQRPVYEQFALRCRWARCDALAQEGGLLDTLIVHISDALVVLESLEIAEWLPSYSYRTEGVTGSHSIISRPDRPKQQRQLRRARRQVQVESFVRLSQEQSAAKRWGLHVPDDRVDQREGREGCEDDNEDEGSVSGASITSTRTDWALQATPGLGAHELSLQAAVLALEVLIPMARNAGEMATVDTLFEKVIQKLWTKCSGLLARVRGDAGVPVGALQGDDVYRLWVLRCTLCKLWWQLMAEISRRNRVYAAWMWDHSSDAMMMVVSSLLQCNSIEPDATAHTHDDINYDGDPSAGQVHDDDPQAFDRAPVSKASRLSVSAANAEALSWMLRWWRVCSAYGWGIDAAADILLAFQQPAKSPSIFVVSSECSAGALVDTGDRGGDLGDLDPEQHVMRFRALVAAAVGPAVLPPFYCHLAELFALMEQVAVACSHFLSSVATAKGVLSRSSAKLSDASASFHSAYASVLLTTVTDRTVTAAVATAQSLAVLASSCLTVLLSILGTKTFTFALQRDPLLLESVINFIASVIGNVSPLSDHSPTGAEVAFSLRGQGLCRASAQYAAIFEGWTDEASAARSTSSTEAITSIDAAEPVQAQAPSESQDRSSFLAASTAAMHLDRLVNALLTSAAVATGSIAVADQFVKAEAEARGESDNSAAEGKLFHSSSQRWERSEVAMAIRRLAQSLIIVGKVLPIQNCEKDVTGDLHGNAAAVWISTIVSIKSKAVAQSDLMFAASPVAQGLFAWKLRRLEMAQLLLDFNLMLHLHRLDSGCVSQAELVSLASWMIPLVDRKFGCARWELAHLVVDSLMTTATSPVGPTDGPHYTSSKFDDTSDATQGMRRQVINCLFGASTGDDAVAPAQDSSSQFLCGRLLEAPIVSLSSQPSAPMPWPLMQAAALSDWVRPMDNFLGDSVDEEPDEKARALAKAWPISCLKAFEGAAFYEWMKILAAAMSKGFNLAAQHGSEKLHILLQLASGEHAHRWFNVTYPDENAQAVDDVEGDLAGPSLELIAPAVPLYCSLLEGLCLSLLPATSCVEANEAKSSRGASAEDALLRARDDLIEIANRENFSATNLLREKELATQVVSKRSQQTQQAARRTSSDTGRASARRLVSGTGSRETGIVDMAGKLLDACMGQHIDHNVHAAALLVLLSPLAPWRVRDKIWREVGNVQLLHLLEPDRATMADLLALLAQPQHVPFQRPQSLSIEGCADRSIQFVFRYLGEDVESDQARATCCRAIVEALSRLRCDDDKHLLVCRVGVSVVARFLFGDGNRGGALQWRGGSGPIEGVRARLLTQLLTNGLNGSSGSVDVPDWLVDDIIAVSLQVESQSRFAVRDDELRRDGSITHPTVDTNDSVGKANIQRGKEASNVIRSIIQIRPDLAESFSKLAHSHSQ